MQRFEGVIKAPWAEKNWLDSGTQQQPLYLNMLGDKEKTKQKKSQAAKKDQCKP